MNESLKRDCPVCMEDMFSSRIPIMMLKCGHGMHSHCYKSFLKAGRYNCPLCSKSLGDFSSSWEQLRQEIALTPMPEEYRDTMVRILCNDCNGQCETAFHILGHECETCHSFNTRRI
jgi:RING finger/CHY zinc finger protein 1